MGPSQQANTQIRRRVANAAEAIAEIPIALCNNPSLPEFDQYRRAVHSLCSAYPDTPMEQIAAHMRQRMETTVVEQLGLISHVKIDVPAKEPEKAVLLLEAPYKAAADDPEGPSLVAPNLEGASDWEGATRSVRLIDYPAAILAWLVREYAITEDDRVAVYWKQLADCKFEGDLPALMQQLEEAVRKLSLLTRYCFHGKRARTSRIC
jgi:hypothetical protein